MRVHTCDARGMPFCVYISFLWAEDRGQRRLFQRQGVFCLFSFSSLNACLSRGHIYKKHDIYHIYIRFLRCHTLEPPTEDEDWVPPITSDDASEIDGEEDDADAAGEEQAPAKPVPCV